MPRAPRQYSESGLYHVVCRGSGRQLLFEDDGDRRAFLRMLKTDADKFAIGILAWCLMSNHIHLLFDDAECKLSEAMHDLATGYARYFNEKTGHVGPVFQGRFTSVPITSDRQLLEAVRYIHENPAKAGIAPTNQYQWSSFTEYLRGAGITRTDMVLDLVGGRAGFLQLFADDRYAYYYVRATKKVPDEEALQAARAALHGLDPAEIKTLPRSKRNDALQLLRASGITIKQIERLTGIGLSTIKRATARKNGPK